MKRIVLILGTLALFCGTASAGFIGNSNVGGATVPVGSNCWYYQRFTADSTGTTDSARIYAAGNDTVYLAFYAVHATYDTLPGALLWIGKPDSAVVTTAGWYKITMTGINLVAATKYFIAYGSATAFNVYKTSGTTSADSTYGGNRCVGYNAGSFVDPAGATSSSKEAKRGLQVFYTTSGGGGGGGGTGLRVIIQKH